MVTPFYVTLTGYVTPERQNVVYDFAGASGTVVVPIQEILNE